MFLIFDFFLEGERGKEKGEEGGGLGDWIFGIC